MKQKEHILQTNCVKWFRLQYPKYYYNLFAIPNGGKRNVRTAINLKNEGVVAGVSDLFLAKPNKEYHGLFIEMKIKPNKTSDNQKKFISVMEKSGYKCEVVYSFDEFKKIIEKWFL